jgi:hypothetical protein
MIKMNIRVEKLSIIEQLINVDDKELLKKIKTLLSKKAKSSLEPIDLETFFAKIDASEKAFEQGKTITQNKLKEEIKNWRKK